MYKKSKHILLHILILSASIQANQGCNISALIEDEDKKFKIREDTVKKINSLDITTKKIELNITKTLKSIHIIHDNHPVVIKRKTNDREETCPPFCIQPIKIEGVDTVGELEVLKFIKELKGKEAKLFIDIRKRTLYNQSTIPGAINIPFRLLKDGSKYQKEVLTLIGGKKIKGKWSFKFVPALLIFGKSNQDNNAVNAIKTLLKLSYPKEKLYYYRAGIKEWNSLGLTLY